MILSNLSKLNRNCTMCTFSKLYAVGIDGNENHDDDDEDDNEMMTMRR